jgi:hypothetical protein
MSKIDSKIEPKIELKIAPRGAAASDSADWNHALSVVAQLAAARCAALRGITREEEPSLPIAAEGPGPAPKDPAPKGSAPKDSAPCDRASATDAGVANLDLANNADRDSDTQASSRRAHAALISTMRTDAAPQPQFEPPLAPVAPDQLARDMIARDMAEIERAAAALRRAEPALEPSLRHFPGLAAAEPRATHSASSVWLLVGVIWLTAVAVVSCAVGTVALLVG